MSKLQQSLVEAWLVRAERAAKFVRAAAAAPGLFKPDAVEQARRDYAHAMREAALREAGQ